MTRMGAPNQAGFTYLAALFLILVMGVVLAAIGQVWSTAQQRENERELLADCLRLAGVRVTTARNGLEAFEMLHDH